MPFAPICFERVSYILVSTEYLSNVACNGQEVKSVVVSRGVLPLFHSGRDAMLNVQGVFF